MVLVALVAPGVMWRERSRDSDRIPYFRVVSGKVLDLHILKVIITVHVSRAPRRDPNFHETFTFEVHGPGN